MSTILIPYVVDVAFYVGWLVMIVGGLAFASWLSVKMCFSVYTHMGIIEDFWKWRGHRIHADNAKKDAEERAGHQMTDIHAVIAELKALEAKATPGEWGTSVYDLRAEHPRMCVHDGNKPPYAMCVLDAATDDDAIFIATSRNALPLLLVYIERLEAVASAAQVLLNGIITEPDNIEMLAYYLDALGRDE